MNNSAFITLATTERYLKMAKNLADQLKKFNSKYDLFIMAPSNLIPIDKNKEYKFKIINIDQFTNQDFPRFIDTINKFQCLKFKDFDKLIYLDADILLTKNIDILFNFTYLAFKYTIYNIFSGGVIYFYPKTTLITYDEIKIKALKMGYATDEDILNNCYTINSVATVPDAESIFTQYGMYHDGGFIKYIDFFNGDITSLNAAGIKHLYEYSNNIKSIYLKYGEANDN